jgi:VWFA-related protein
MQGIIAAMRRLLIGFLLLASHAAAQTSPQPPAARFRSGAEVIAIDVTVIGKDGSPVAGLTAADFDITVEGKPRAIQSAQFLGSDSSPRIALADESSNADATSGRLLLIVTDDVSLRPSSFAVVRAAKALLKNLGPGDLVGVTHVPEGGGVPFTADHSRVIAELSRMRPPAPKVGQTETRVYISEALDYDQQRRYQWPAALMRECAAEADSPVYRLCVFNLEQTARTVLIESSMHTNDTIRGLERLMKSLEPSGQPVTVVFISESLVLARDPAALVGLAEACAEARVTLHIVQPAPPTAEMTARGFPSDPVMDTALNREGLEQMAALTRGAFHHAVSTGETIFEQIGREISGYYLLGIEPDAEDRQKRRRRVDVKVRRPGLTVRARSMFALDGRTPDAAIEPSTRLRQMLEAPLPTKGVPVRITARTISGDGRQVRVLVAGEVGEPTDQRTRFHVGLIAIDSNGAVKARSAASTILDPSRRDAQSPSLFSTSLMLDPGEYSVRLAVVDETGRSGSVHHTVHARLREWPRGFSTSDLIVANQPAGFEFPPFNASSIVDSPSVAAVIDVVHDDRGPLDAARVRFEINGESVEATAEGAAQRRSQFVRSFAAMITPPKTGVQQLRAIVTPASGEPITLERTFAFEPAGNGDPLSPSVMRGYIEMLEQRHQISPSLSAFVASAKSGAFGPPPDAESRPDGDVAMVTFIGGLAALRDDKPATARVLLQQTLRRSPGFEGATFYLALIR